MLVYYLILIPLSLLPMQVLYGISSGLKVIVYSVLKYRLKVVRSNLKRSFPEKSTFELRKIESAFYSHLCDLIIESIKAFTMSEALARKKMTYSNVELIKRLYEEGKSVVLVGGHHGNWELLALTIQQVVPHRSLALFTPIKSAFFNKKMQATRERFGLKMLPIEHVKEIFEANPDVPVLAIFGSDQSPRNPDKAYWMTFLNQDTGVQFGAEKFAREYKTAVVYGGIHRLKRGHFQTEFRLICDDASQTPYGAITEKHTRWLEEKVIASPSFWLWSHKRWKHKRPKESKVSY